MTRIPYAQSALKALLDALERELLAAPADEVRDAWRATGRTRNFACEELRTLLDDAIAASDDCSTATLPLDTCAAPDRLFDVSRKQRFGMDGHRRLSAAPAWSFRRH
jgi:hypothetical protein